MWLDAGRMGIWHFYAIDAVKCISMGWSGGIELPTAGLKLALNSAITTKATFLTNLNSFKGSLIARRQILSHIFPEWLMKLSAACKNS